MTVRREYESPSHGDPTPPCEATDLVDAILRAAQQIRRLLNERMEACGLNEVRYAVLDAVSRSADRGGCSQSELAARLEQSESSVSMLIDRMRADRLLHRLRAPTDRRRRRLVLTDEGRSLLEQGGKIYAGFVDALRKVLGGEDRLQRLLNDLSAALADKAFTAELLRSPAAKASRTTPDSSAGSRHDTSEISPAA